MSNIPGMSAQHAIITPVCRHNKTDMGAFDESVERMRKTYLSCLEGRGEDGSNYHLVLTVETFDNG
jgi:hypothetical protein